MNTLNTQRKPSKDYADEIRQEFIKTEKQVMTGYQEVRSRIWNDYVDTMWTRILIG